MVTSIMQILVAQRYFLDTYKLPHILHHMGSHLTVGSGIGPILHQADVLHVEVSNEVCTCCSNLFAQVHSSMDILTTNDNRTMPGLIKYIVWN